MVKRKGGKKYPRAIAERDLHLLAQKFLKQLGERKVTLDIFLLPHAEIKKIKRRFIKKQTEPNVLAFPEPRRFPHPETRKTYLGEIYLNGDILNKNPERANSLLLHGILHLLGHDHKKNSDAKRMEILEQKIIQQKRGRTRTAPLISKSSSFS